MHVQINLCTHTYCCIPKKARVLQENAAIFEAKRTEEKQQMGRAAYEQWLTSKRVEWQRAQKERHQQEGGRGTYTHLTSPCICKHPTHL